MLCKESTTRGHSSTIHSAQHEAQLQQVSIESNMTDEQRNPLRPVVVSIGYRIPFGTLLSTVRMAAFTFDR